MNPHNNNTIYCGVARENWDKLENDWQDKGASLMHIWRGQRSTLPKTIAYTHAYDTIQLPIGCRWNLDCTKDCQDVVLDRMAKFKELPQWCLDGQPLLEAVLVCLSPMTIWWR